jgi:hypothetical protein
MLQHPLAGGTAAQWGCHLAVRLEKQLMHIGLLAQVGGPI